MVDVTAKRFDEMDSLQDGLFVRVRAELGVSAFGLQVLNLPAGFDGYPEHAHVGMPFPEGNDGQEEVYLPLAGTGTLIAGEERVALEPGMAARVGPGQLRKIVTASTPLQIAVIGAMPGRAYVPPALTEIGASPPQMPS